MMRQRHLPSQGLTVIFKRQFSFNSIAAGIGCLIGLAPGLVGSALAMDITIVQQTALEFICMFAADCKSGPAAGGGITPPWPSSDQRLWASTFTASSGSPAEGTTVYLYRLDLSRDSSKYSECVAGVSLNFGPLAQIPPVTANKAHIYVITTGDAAGTIPIRSAEQDGDLIELSFDADLCGGKSSLMFALPSTFPPTQGRGAILQFGNPPLSPTKVFAPKYPGAQTAPSNLDDPQ